jgi:hypothetical protein
MHNNAPWQKRARPQHYRDAPVLLRITIRRDGSTEVNMGVYAEGGRGVTPHRGRGGDTM